MWKIYIISVKESLERRTNAESFKEKVEKLGIKVEIIDAIFWKTSNVMDKMNELGISFSNVCQSQIACFLSHRLAWEKAMVCNEKSIIIEDDMVSLNFDLLSAIENEINPEIDGIIMWKHPNRICDFEYVSTNLIKFYKQWGLCAYFVRQHLCEKMLYIKYIDRPIDDYLYENIFPDYKMLMTAKDLFTNIGFLGFNDTNYKFKSLIWNH